MSLTGGLYNFDSDEPQALACPVPYFRDTNDLKPITVKVVVEDLHHQLGITAFLCGRDSTGPKICDSGSNFPSVFGTATIELTIQPASSTRFVWIEVVIPDNDEDNNPWTLNGTSGGCLGYRVGSTIESGPLREDGQEAGVLLLPLRRQRPLLAHAPCRSRRGRSCPSCRRR